MRRLAEVWSHPRAPGASGPRKRDWLILASLLVALAIEVSVRREIGWHTASPWLVALSAPTLLFRRARPLAALGVAFGVSGAFALLELALGRHEATVHTATFALVLVYSLSRWGAGWETLLGVPLLSLSAALGLAAQHPKPGDVLGACAVIALALSLGATARLLARARARELEQVKLRERERLARDLHDTVAHHVSAIAIRAQAGLATAVGQPNAPLEALRVIEAEASRTLAEMRAMVRVLRRDEPAELAPAPAISDLHELVRRANWGPEVRLEITGEVGGLPLGLSTAVYRLAQESITNARRHARRATRIEVVVSTDDATVRLCVRDDGERGRTSPGVGYGLRGMAQRAEQLGGTFEAGPNPDRGWTVIAILPRNESFR